MKEFQGFPSGKVQWVHLPEPFFTDLLPLIEDADELKFTLFFFWAISKQEGSVVYLDSKEVQASTILHNWFFSENSMSAIQTALEKALSRKTIIAARSPQLPDRTLYFLNSPSGRAAAESFTDGTWSPNEADHLPLSPVKQPVANVYKLYEDNIGPLTPLIAEDLKEAQSEYSAQWIEEAIHLAVQNNKRSWRYVFAILKSWKKEGKNANSR